MGRSILVVEDNTDIRGLLERFLEMEGFTVDAVADGAAALDFLRSRDVLPDLITLDLMMPVMDGWEFRERQLKDEVLSGIPVIVLSASGEVAARPVDADDRLRKPVDFGQLRSSIDRLTTPSMVELDLPGPHPA